MREREGLEADMDRNTMDQNQDPRLETVPHHHVTDPRSATVECGVAPVRRNVPPARLRSR